MDTPPYKVAYMDAATPLRLYSDFFSTEADAKNHAQTLKAEGYETMTFKKVSQDGTYYEWQILPDASTWKYRLGIFLTSIKFVVPLVLVIFAYLLLRRNNGLPRVIG